MTGGCHGGYIAALVMCGEPRQAFVCWWLCRCFAMWTAYIHASIVNLVAFFTFDCIVIHIKYIFHIHIRVTYY